MDQSQAYSAESHFGPPSQPISVSDFEKDVLNLRLNATSPSIADSAVAEECRLDDVCEIVNGAVRNPSSYAHVIRTHFARIDALYDERVGDPGKSALNRRKRKYGEINTGTAGSSTATSASMVRSEELEAFKRGLEGVQLKSYPYPDEAGIFVRPPKSSDVNTLLKPKLSPSHNPQAEAGLVPVCLLSVSVYNRVTWGNHLSLSSRHTALTSQTLGDFYECIPCASNEVPSEVVEDNVLVGYEASPPPIHKGAVICIEGIAYGDGEGEEDYSDKLLKHATELGINPRVPSATIPRKGPCMHDSTFSSLTIRLHQPYWILHQGNCEHFLVFDELRASISSDVGIGYPITYHITPIGSASDPLCQACTKVPAVYAIVNDIRLAQSPCRLCAHCWSRMGLPGASSKIGGDQQIQHDQILVVPLSNYAHGRITPMPL